MSNNVEFDVDKVEYTSRPGMSSSSLMNSSGKNEPKMVQWLIRHGIVNSPHTAQAVLIVVVVINLVITYIIVKYFL